MKSTLFAALTITVLLCSIGLSCSQKIPPSAASPSTAPAPQQTTTAPPTLLSHFYNNYATDRPTIKKLIDGTRAAIFFLSQQNASSWLGNLLPLAPFSVVQEDYRDAIKAAIDIFEIEPSANALDTTVLNGVKSDVCAWLSSEISGFTCTVNTIQQLSRTLELYQTLRNARDQVVALDGGDQVIGGSVYTTGHYRCAWVNSHALDSCLNIPVPRSLSPKVMKLEEIFRCSAILPAGDYALCSNVA